MKRFRQANKGFSLIELIVAVAMLAIIVAPLLNTFVVSAKVAAQGRQTRNKTLLAQNLVEISESQKMNELLKCDPFRDITTDVAVYNKVGSNYEKVDEEIPANQAQYYIGLKDASSASSEFDAMLTFNAEDYSEVNDFETVTYSPMDSVYVQPSEADRNPDKLAAISFADKASIETGLIIEPEYFTDKMERTIEIELSKIPDASGSDSGVITVSANYMYQAKYGDFSMQEENNQGDFFHCKYDSTNQGIQSVYVFYYPCYSGNDKILIQNMDDIQLDAFLIKQKKTHDDTESVLMTKEADYEASIELRESGASSEKTPILKVHSNMSTNLFNGKPIVGNFPYKAYKGSYRYFYPTFSKQMVSKTKKNRLYSVTVELFEKGEDFKESSRVLTLVGSKTN